MSEKIKPLVLGKPELQEYPGCYLGKQYDETESEWTARVLERLSDLEHMVYYLRQKLIDMGADLSLTSDRAISAESFLAIEHGAEFPDRDCSDYPNPYDI